MGSLSWFCVSIDLRKGWLTVQVKKNQQILGGIILFHMVIMLLVGILFNGADASLTGGEIIDFNVGWTSTGRGGKAPIEELPYRWNSAAGETLILERQIPAEYMGRTLFFISAGKELLIRMDGTEIYSFGRGDKSFLLRSPGSAIHFVELPEEGDGYLEIEVKSPYADAAACVERMRIAERDTAILQVIGERLPILVCSLLLLIEGIVILLLAGMQKLSKKPTDGMVYVGVLLFWAALAYAVETGLLSLRSPGHWSGGQAACSYLVYAYMMCVPILLLAYEMQKRQSGKNRVYKILSGVCIVNIVLQFILQLANIVGFFQLTWISLLLNIMCAGFILYQLSREKLLTTVFAEKQSFHGVPIEMSAIGLMVVGSLADLLMFLIRRYPDLAVFGRWSMLIYGLIMIWGYVHKIVENRQEEELDKKKLLELEVERKTGELRKIQEQTEKMLSETIEALSNAVDAKDRYTSGHSRRVAEYARMLAERMGLDETKKKQIYMAGLLHDIGKIRIPDEIINKAGKLTEEEFNYIKLHTIAGNHILKEISSIEEISVGAKYHHERYDGKGYPNGLEGENIPQIARIIGIADAYDAMASNRSYRKALPQYLVREEIVKGKGTQFDPVIAEHMLALIDEDKEYQMKQTDSLQRTILVVDNEPVYIKIVQYILRDEPMYTILYSYEGHEALKILEEERVDLLLLDIKMPDMDGFEVMEEVRKRNIDVVATFMSADKDFETIERANALGMSDYLTKPFLPIELKEIVHSLIES